MVLKKSQKAQEFENKIAEAVLGVQTSKFKSSYQAAKVLGLNKNIVAIRINSGST
jgi:stage V sporulation protein SpoVS